MVSGTIGRNLNMVSSVKVGTASVDKKEFIARLELLYEIMNYSQKPYCQKIATDLNRAIVELKSDCTTGMLRQQPFCIVLYGEPGVGKSSSAVRIAQACMRAKYGHFNDYDMVALNETDRFQSEYRTSHKVVLFDDIDASKPTCADTINPYHKVIDFVNNIEKTALNPNVDMKGKVYIRPDLVILTTNRRVKDNSLGCSFVRSPGALARRFNYVIHLHSGFERCSVKKTVSVEPTSDTCTFGENVRVDDVQGYQNIDRDILYEFLAKEFMEHDRSQREFIDYMNAFFDNLAKPESDTGEDIYSPQSGSLELPDSPQSDLLSRLVDIDSWDPSICDRYYADHVDWDYFIVHLEQFPYGYRYFLEPDGRLKPIYDSTGVFTIGRERLIQIFNEYILYSKNRRIVAPPGKGLVVEVIDSLPSPEIVEENLCSDDPLQPNIIDSSELPCNDDDSLVYTDISEDLQINTALSCFSNIKWCPIRTLKYVRHGTLEIDLIVEYDEVIFVIECKRSKSSAPSGKKQAKRSSALVHYYSGKRTIGLIYDYFGFKLVCDYGQQINIHGYKAFLKRVPHSDYLFHMGDAAPSQIVSLRNIPDISSYITKGFELNSDLVLNYVL